MAVCSTTTTRDFISNLYIFRSEKARNLVSFAQSESHIEYFKKGTKVIQENARSNDFGYIIMSGAVDVHIEWEQVAVLESGDIFGEYAPIVRRNRTATVTAKTDISCLVLKKWILIRLISVGSELNRIILKRVTENRRNKRGVFRFSH